MPSPLTFLRSRFARIATSVVSCVGLVVGAAQLDAERVTAGVAGGRIQSDTGVKLYLINCSPCHQANGQGGTVAELTYPPLAGSEWVTGSESKLLRVVISGLTGEIEVQGEMFSGAMPGWGPVLDDGQIAAIATYVRSNWGNKAAPVTATTVAKIRKESAARTTPWTEAELRRIGG